MGALTAPAAPDSGDRAPGPSPRRWLDSLWIAASSPQLTIALAVLLAFFNLSPIYVVNQYEQALVVRLGEPRRVTDEAGIHFKIPGIEHVEKIDKRVLSYEGTQEEELTEIGRAHV